ncbi:DoxX family protein [Sinomicrobium weinanense]|uniref:DoxX family membrane protein n=1 Tax=Sinomicrobium weinanense TaxID=2842200 RepID=A0A926Q3M7_9FLAO|nr:hypothetical protein [Sinomicrobium weinanense]MBC9795955.1 hypothetical protein [Sinomicrobium weinanense]MBU3122074.1 hypothetical protein [Sinomicrobium weinanense]
MKPLIVLVVTFAISLVISGITTGKWDLSFSGRVAMAVMLLFTSIGHFKFTEGMALMLPDFIPAKRETVLATGVIEIIAAIGLFIPPLRVLTAWLLILFFVLILPANIHAALHHVNLEKATYDGSGINYLWFRVPLQLLFIGWVYFFVIRS